MSRLRATHLKYRLRDSPLEPALLLGQGVLAASCGYLLVLLAAARSQVGAASRPGSSDGEPSRLVVLIPAHDEEGEIGSTLRALAACEYPGGARRTVVIADNCSDRTAALAAAEGADVWERDDRRRGKGEALGWALRRLRPDADAFDAVVVLDADCVPSPNMLRALDERLRAGATAVQVSYVVGNPDASNASALRFGAFALMNGVRCLGKERLGLSCGLAGTGMALSADLLRAEPWTSTGLAEDGEYHMRVVLAGGRVEFAPAASVSSAMPTTLRGAEDQQARWEGGKLELVRTWVPRLVRAGLARRSATCLHAGVECLVPPQSLIAAGTGGSALLGALLGSRRLFVLAVATFAAQLAFVAGGLRLVGAPRSVYRALLTAPLLIASKLALYARLLAGHGPTAWVRTPRDGSGAAG